MKTAKETAIPGRPALRLRVTAAAENRVRAGHPWVFAQSVRGQNRPGTTGELAVIFDRADHFLAIGLFDARSPIRVRVLHAGKPQPLDPAWWRQRAAKALALRHGLFDPQTTGFRCINGENDGWPGLVLDQYGATRVLKIYTAAWLPRLDETADLLKGEARLILRLSRNIQKLALDEYGVKDGQILRGAGLNSPQLDTATSRFANPLAPQSGERVRERGSSHPTVPVPASAPLDGPVIFLENGLRFEADVLRGQKTGFFLDQRENRRNVEALAQGRSVLNLFSYSGAFSVYAARGGAVRVCSLDISEHALAAARRNFALNQDHPSVPQCRHETLQADAFLWLREQPEERFDLIILDPPSLAKRESEKDDAIAAYAKLIEASLARLNKNGILVAASCSAHVSAEEFFTLARASAQKSGRKFTELRTTQHAPDHPATFPEGEYLKCIYFRLTD
ncbi:MAG: class I SAM-dependent methyltransferase [Verrucomicrobiota bacterium]